RPGPPLFPYTTLFRSREADRPGLLCANPPYGVRLADREGARTLHRELGEVLRERFQGWDTAVLTGAPELGMELGLRAHRTHRVRSEEHTSELQSLRHL